MAWRWCTSCWWIWAPHPRISWTAPSHTLWFHPGICARWRGTTSWRTASTSTPQGQRTPCHIWSENIQYINCGVTYQYLVGLKQPLHINYILSIVYALCSWRETGIARQVGLKRTRTRTLFLSTMNIENSLCQVAVLCEAANPHSIFY